MSRGPKPKTAKNSRRGTVGFIRHETLDSPCDLTKAAEAEYSRLVEVLTAKGTIERVDLAVVAECARIKALLDRAHAAVGKTLDWPGIKLVGFLTSQRRGLLRELGLTTQPCRSVTRTNPVGSERDDDDKWAKKLKVS